MLSELEAIPQKVQQILDKNEGIKLIAKQLRFKKLTWFAGESNIIILSLSQSNLFYSIKILLFIRKRLLIFRFLDTV